LTCGVHLRKSIPHGSAARIPLNSVGGPCFSVQLTQPHLIGLGPEHLDMYVKAGFTKDQIAKAIWEKARIPFSSWAKDVPSRRCLGKNSEK